MLAKKKIITLLFILTLCLASAMPLSVFAQEDQGGYIPLAPLPNAAPEGQPVSFPNYVQGLVQLLIGVAGVLAVIVIIIGGIQYITAGDSESQTSDAKERIWKALIGLILAIGAWLILFTINPNLLKENITIETAPTPQAPQGEPPEWAWYRCSETAEQCISERTPFISEGCQVSSCRSNPPPPPDRIISDNGDYCFAYWGCPG